MSRPSTSRRLLGLVTCSLLVGGALTTTAAPAQAAPGHGRHARVLSVFPTNDLTVRDRSQLTGRRVALPLPDCATRPTDCDAVRLLDQLDGFDLDPRLALRFDRAVDPAAVAAATTVSEVGGGRSKQSTGVDRVVYDPATHTVYAHPREQLDPGTTYRLRVHPSRTLPEVHSTFTTLSATDGLLDLRRQLDDGTAHRTAGIGAALRGLRVEHTFPAAGTSLSYVADVGSGKTASSSVPTLVGGAGSYVFGSYLAPQWLDGNAVIAQTPTRDSGPTARSAQRLPFVLVTPKGTAPAGGWPIAIYGHGFTRSDGDVFLAAAANAGNGIATIATDVAGHGYGPGSAWSVTSGGTTTTFPAYGRGVDLDRNGTIASTEGSTTLPTPSPYALVGSRDGLRQTVADLMTLVRALKAEGPRVSLRTDAVNYFGQSFGGIYGVMLGGVDPLVPVLAPNVSGGPITEIVRLSPSFRLLDTQLLAGASPQLLNGPFPVAPDFYGFTESMPLRGDAPVTAPAPGALAIQDFIAKGTWLNRPGSPETFAPLLRRSPPPGSSPKKVLFQNAFGDRTVPNPTTYTVLAAGHLFDRESLYRNDRTTSASRNPHGFLLDPLTFPQGALPGQQQIATFFRTGATVDPDGRGPVWETPIASPQILLDLNFPSALHS
jgi:Bacterial Ig-like domain